MKNPSLESNLSQFSVSNIVEHLIQQAVSLNSSDIHLDPFENNIKIRFRIDGVLHSLGYLPKKLHDGIIFRLKVLAEIRTDEHQRSQDGRFFFVSGEGLINIRLSLIPTYYGTNAVLRVLKRPKAAYTLDELGFGNDHIQILLRTISKSSGMILITGPTGSGKTTTLYSLLSLLQQKSASIVTIEDPIEYTLENITQIPVNNYSFFNFSNALRSVLRQDPDIIMVGEIRDKETARLAFGSAMTGHLLLSTLHTNSAALTLTRLLDLGIEPYVIAGTLSVIVNQRLVRKLCSNCKELSQPVGCSHCHQSGFKGRLVIAEILEVDDFLRKTIHRGELIQPTRSIKENGLGKVSQQITSMEEVLKSVYE